MSGLCRIHFWGVAVVMVLASGLSAADEVQRAEKWTPEIMLEMRKVGHVNVSPDGRWAAYVVRRAETSGDLSEYVSQIHLARTDGSRSFPLTQGAKSNDDPQWSPDGAWIAFASNRDGKRNIWCISVEGGEAFKLTNHNADVTSHRWSPDGRTIAYTAAHDPTEEDQRKERQRDDARIINENDKQVLLWTIEFSGATAKPEAGQALTEPKYTVVARQFDWSPNGKTIVFAHTNNPTQDNWGTSNLSTINVATQEVTPLVATPAVEATPWYSPDGKSIAFVKSDDPPTWAGLRRVHVIPAGGGASRELAATEDGFGRYSELLGWSDCNNRLYYTEAHGTALRIMALPLEGTPLIVFEQPGMCLGGVTLNTARTHFGFGWETTSTPPEVYVGPVKDFVPKQISQAHKGVTRGPDLRTEVIAWSTPTTAGDPGRKTIEGLLTYPVGYKPGKRYPLLLVIHGGPMGVFTQTFDGNPGTYPVAAFASEGYFVLRPNPRGSSGYGQTFRYANYNDWGGGDYADILMGVEHCIQLGIADPEQLGVMGWSYGGFMTAWTITHTSRFKAASVGAAVTNLVSFTGTADIPGFLPDYFKGESWDQDENYRKHSPMSYVKNAKTPALIQHGEKDERVPLSQGMEFYNALKRLQCPTQMSVYPRQPHSIDEPRLLLHCMQGNLEWFKKYLPPNPRD